MNAMVTTLLTKYSGHIWPHNKWTYKQLALISNCGCGLETSDVIDIKFYRLD